MTDGSMRSIFKNDSSMGRYLDGDDDRYDESPRSSVFGTTDTDSGSTLVDGPARGVGTGYNTGPKGVRSDFAAFDLAQAQARHTKASRGAAMYPGAAPWTQERDEEDARERWVEARLKQLSKARSGESAMERVGAARYLEVLDACPSVCVLIHHDHDHDDDDQDEDGDGREEADEWSEAMGSLAHKYAGLKMIRLPHHEAELDKVACPAVLVYRDGNLVVNAMRVVDELPSGEEITRRSVEAVLLRLGVLKEEYRLDRE